MMDFTLPYQAHQRKIADALRTARATGVTRYQTTHSAREVDPTRLTDRKIDELALREAQRYTERIINKHNAGVG